MWRKNQHKNVEEFIQQESDIEASICYLRSDIPNCLP